MNGKEIFNAIGKAEDKYIEEAAPKERKSRIAWVKRGAIAACLTLIVYAAAVRFVPAKAPVPNASEGKGNLPMLTISSETGGMGFEACMAHDISELANGNPWTAETKLSTMPVYKNNAAYGSNSSASPGIGEKRALALARQAADSLNMKITSVQSVKCGDPAKDGGTGNDATSSVTVETATAKIQVLGNGTITISFKKSIELPKQYSFTYADPSDEKAENVTDYLLNRFSGFVSFKKPQKALFADYTFDGERNRSYTAYDAMGNITEQILNYNFNQVEFAPDDDGALMLIRKHNGLSCAEKIGDYPIVTSKKALELLLKGRYNTSVPEKMPGEKHVMKTELVYKTGGTNQIFLPYYRFWVELPDMRLKNGLKTYGAYYVPAVQQRYISNMPLWDGSFN